MSDHLHTNGEAPIESPAEAMDRLAGRLEGVQRRAVGKTTEYSRAGVAFAAREADVLTFRLREEVVKAAMQTLDTAPSPRGPEWIALAPATADEFALDRAAAWFESAWRFAGSAPERAQQH
jgi:hypothetical protein